MLRSDDLLRLASIP